MSRKSRQNAANWRKSIRLNALIVLMLLLAVGIIGVLMLMQRPALRPIDRADAIERRVTVENVQPWTRRHRRHAKQRGYLLDTEEIGRLYVKFGWQRIPGAEDWPAGTALTVLLNPRDPDDVLGISQDGVALISFEDTASQRAAAYAGRLRGAVLCFAADAAGVIVLAIWYWRKMQTAPNERERSPR